MFAQQPDVDEPPAPSKGVAEFRGGRRAALGVMFHAGLLAFVVVLIALVRSYAPRQKVVIAVVAAVLALSTLFQVIAWLASRRGRLTVSDSEIRIAAGMYSHVFRLDDIRAATYVKDRNHLVLRLADGSCAPLDAGAYWRFKKATRLILSRLGQSIPHAEVRSDLSAGPVAAVLVPAAILGFLFPLAVGEPILGGALAFSAGGIIVGALVGLGILRFGPSRRRRRFTVGWSCFGIVAVASAVVGYLTRDAREPALYGTPPVEIFAAVAFGLGLVIPLALARAREINAAVRKSMAPPK